VANPADRGQQKGIFCGQTGARTKITREHTFPNWINKVLTRAVVGPDITCERSIQQGPQARTVNTWKADEVADNTVRTVCEPCNTGWMRRASSLRLCPLTARP
jgi:hypothetical protein